jgi:hypothetical protein
VYSEFPALYFFNDCDFTECGWDGQGANLNNVASGGNVGYDSSQVDLQNFAAGGNVGADGGAIHIENAVAFSANDNTIANNLKGIELVDCGRVAGAEVFMGQNNITRNLGVGFAALSSTGDALAGCKNVTFHTNAVTYNGDTGIYIEGGLDNLIGVNQVKGNWGAGWKVNHGGNVTVRTIEQHNNDRSPYTAIGNDADNASSLIRGTTIDSDATFMVKVDGGHIESTEAASAQRVGIKLHSELGQINDKAKAKIQIDNVSFYDQEYAVLIEDGALSNGGNRVTSLYIGDLTYVGSTIKDTENLDDAKYFELPYSNQHTSAVSLDVSRDVTLFTVILKEGVGGNVINTYPLNTLFAYDDNGTISISQKDSDKIQIGDIDHTNVTIDGVAPSPNTIGNVVNELNALFMNTGSITTNVPVITSPLTINTNQGSVINYELTADYGVGYEWELLPTITTVEGNVRKLIGGTGLAEGTHEITARAINYNGIDEQTISIVV